MAGTTRTVRVRFDGSARGLEVAAKRGEHAVDSFRRNAEKKVAPEVGSAFLDVFATIPAQLKGAAILAAITIGASMAPALASAIISGVLLAVGGGVLAAGIIGAAKDPKVVRAWQKFGKQAGAVFHKFAQPFIKPLVRAAETFGKALKRAEPTILAIGRVMAPAVDKLAPALAGIAERSMPGFLKAAEASIPFLEALLDPRLGDSISGFFENVAKGAPQALAFFQKFMGFIRDILPKLGSFLTWLSDMGAKMEAFWRSPEFTKLREALDSFAEHTLAGIRKGWDYIGKAIDENADKWREIRDNVAEFIAFAGPGFEKLVTFIGTSAATGIVILSNLALWISRILEGLTKIDDLYRKLTGEDTAHMYTRQYGSGGEWGAGNLPGFAGGGYGSGLVMTGEKGRELVDLGPGGRVYSHSDTEKMLASGGDPMVIENHIHVGDEVVRVVRTEISETNRRTKRRVLAGAGAR